MRDDDYLWDPAATADPEVQRLENALRPLRFRGEGEIAPLALTRPRRRWPRVTAALAAAAVVAAIGAGAWLRSLETPWTVSPIRGSNVAVGVQRPGSTIQLAPGDWVQTGTGSTARIRVGRIGSAELGPGSRVRLVRARGKEHRMAMEYGTMHARIWAPPRFFLVETPSALAIDLGCIYTLRLDARGAGVLRVESGEVELVRGGRRAFVVAGNEATLAPEVGPGLPYPVAADSAFRAALAAYEASGGAEALGRLLAASSAKTTITLWHLLQRVGADDREAVYARLTELAPPPDGVARDAVLRLERRDLQRWRRAMERSWTTESVPAWKRAWRRLWTMTA